MDLSDRLEEALRISGKTRLQLAAEIGVTPSSISHWITGRTKHMRGETAAKIEGATGVRAAWLMTGEGVKLVREQMGMGPGMEDIRQIPCIDRARVVDWLRSGDPYDAGGAPEWLLSTGAQSPRAFALQIRDNSMQPELRPGDQVIVDPAVEPAPGDYVLALSREEGAVLRKYRPRGADDTGRALIELKPLNDDYPTVQGDASAIEVLGTVIEHRRYRRPPA